MRPRWRASTRAKNGNFFRSGIVRNRLKIDATISKPRHFFGQKELTASIAISGILSVELRFRMPENPRQVPAETPLSIALSKDLSKRGFRFVGPTIVTP